VLITSLQNVHTARRFYRLSVQVSLLDSHKLKIKQTLALRGKRSRNKVSVGEPAEGSFINMFVLL
jgi:hypothetical protein